MRLCFPPQALFLIGILSVEVSGQEPERVTPTVRLIEQIESAVVPLFSQDSEGNLSSGTGAVIDSRGYILTADHVTKSNPGVAMFGLTRAAYRVVGRIPERDLAVLKVSPEHVEASISLGRSHDLMAGESIMVAGNPGGRGIVFARGIINSPAIDPSWPSILVKSYWRNDLDEAKRRQRLSTGGRSVFIQFDASSNRGNSGGPLVNQLGQLIGLVSQKSFEEEAINWAIPIDAIRLLGPYFLQPEEKEGCEVGLQMRPLVDGCVVKSVRLGSAAGEAGIGPGDRVISLDGTAVSSGLEYLLRISEKRVGEPVAFQIDREGSTRSVELICQPYQRFITVADDTLTEGIDYTLYQGRFAMMPDFDQFEPVKKGTIDEISYQEIVAQDATEYAIVFEGYLEFPSDGLFRIELGSDDASKLYLDGQLIIDNDLPHPYQRLGRWVRVSVGPIPFRLEYAETSGQKALDLTVKRKHEDEAVSVRFWREDHGHGKSNQPAVEQN